METMSTMLCFMGSSFYHKTFRFPIPNLFKNIYFKGTEEQWNAITENSGKDCLFSAIIYYNSTGTELTAKTLSLDTISILSDESSSLQNYTYTEAVPSTDYLLLAVNSTEVENILSSDNLFYIDQQTADESGSVTFSYIVPENCSYIFIGDFGKGEYCRVVSSEISTDTSQCTICSFDDNEGQQGTTPPETIPTTTTTTTTTTSTTTSTTTTTTDKNGTVTETTKQEDGSTTVVETKKDGTVTTTETDAEGNKTETVEAKDGTVTTTETTTDGTVRETVENTDGTVKETVTTAEGTKAVAETDADGVKTTTVTVTADSDVDGDGAADLPVSVNVAEKGDKADSIIISTDDGTEETTVTIPLDGASAGTVAVVVNPDGTETVVRDVVTSGDSVTVTVADGTTLKFVDNSKDFDDVSRGDWFNDAVDFASSHELFSGTSETTFTPNATMTRGMLAMVLHNLQHNPEAEAPADFNDVSSQYFAKAVAWAAGEGIISGYGDGQFGPNDSITREQLAVMLYRFAGSPGANGPALTNKDAGDVSGYAAPAMRWAVENGIISGDTDGRLNPKGDATRAQVASMMMRFCKAH